MVIRLLGIYLVVGVIGGLLMYNLAKARGNRPWPWFVIGALTGPLVIFLILWAQKNSQYQNKDDRD